MMLFLWLTCTVAFVSSCVDLLFVVDSTSTESVDRSVKIANELGRRDLFLSVVSKKSSRYVSVTAKNKADLIEMLHHVQGSYEELLKAVSKKIARKTNERPLIVLLFSETETPPQLLELWKELQNTTLHVFRVGTATNNGTLTKGQGVSFDKLISCAKKIHETTDIRRVVSSTKTSRQLQIKEGSLTTSEDFGATTKQHPTFKRPSTSAPRISTTNYSSKSASLKSSLQTPIRLQRNRFERKGAEAPEDAIKSLYSRKTATMETITIKETTAKPAPPGCVADILFLIDFSKGTGEKSQNYFDIAASAVGLLPIGADAVRVGMIGYSGPGRATALFHLNKHDSKDDLIEELFKMQQHGGTTRTGEAIRFAKKEFEAARNGARKGSKRVIVLFTDGFSQDDPVPAAEEARHEGIQIITVSVADTFSPNEEELRAITGRKELLLISPKGQQIREKILGKECNL